MASAAIAFSFALSSALASWQALLPPSPSPLLRSVASPTSLAAPIQQAQEASTAPSAQRRRYWSLDSLSPRPLIFFPSPFEDSSRRRRYYYLISFGGSALDPVGSVQVSRFFIHDLVRPAPRNLSCGLYLGDSILLTFFCSRQNHPSILPPSMPWRL